MSIISVKNLSCVYGEGTPYRNVALDDISFDINKGEIIGIVGHTGSGKSTLVQHLNGLIRAEKGHIFLDGNDIWEEPKKINKVRYKVGLVFQYPEYQLFEETAYKDIAYGPKNMGLGNSEIDTRVRIAANLVGLAADSLDKSPFDFSGGQKRRVAIAGVIAMQPEVLILDEPSAGLDPRGRDNIYRFIRNYRDRTGATVIVVSHNMDDISSCADRLMVLSSGKIVSFDTPSNVFSNREAIESYSLELPSAARIADDLRKKGMPIPDGILTTQELLDVLYPLLSGGDGQ